ncbi:DNA-damage-repair/toleration protein DRT111, chloroplastic-like protein [Drosera capensis]
MLGGLYGDLPPPSTTTTTATDAAATKPLQPAAVWSSAAKFAPPTLRKPQSTTTTTTPTSHLPKPPKTLTNPNLNPNPPPPPQTSASSFQPALVGVTASVVEEYDPARPNDYEEYRRERRRKAAEAEVRREMEKRRQEEEEWDRKEKERESDREKDNRNVSGEEAWKRRAAMSGGGGGVPRSPSPPIGSGGNGDGFLIGKSESGGLGVGAGGQMTAAQRMMAKMGWKEGQGLGRQEQGITTPLMAKKTDRRAGVIVNASEVKSEVKPPEKKVKSVNFNGTPTRVLLLKNMVGPGEVDDELDEEVGSECAKYGTVTRVLIFEITELNFPSDEAVRIFVQFERSEETTRAYVDLDGRYFGGRVVHAAFYDEERFSKNELAPLPGEIPGF